MTNNQYKNQMDAVVDGLVYIAVMATGITTLLAISVWIAVSVS